MSEEIPSNIERVKFRTNLGIKVKVKESEYQKNLDNLTGEIPIVKPT